MATPRTVLLGADDVRRAVSRIAHEIVERDRDLAATAIIGIRSRGDILATRLREASHKLAGMVSAFSSVAGGVASELEDLAARGQLEEARPLVARLEAMAGELTRLAGGLSIEALRDHAGTAGP